MLRIVEDIEVMVGQLVGLVGLVGLDQLLDQVQHAPELVRVVMVNLDQGFQFLFMGERDPFQFFLDALVTLRSEEHTSELQSQSNLVCRLLLEKKKKKKIKYEYVIK